MEKGGFKKLSKELRVRIFWGVLMAFISGVVFIVGTPLVEFLILICIGRLSYEWVHLKKEDHKKDQEVSKNFSIIYLGVFQSAVFLTARLEGAWWALGVFCILCFVIYVVSPEKYRNWNALGCSYLSAILISSAWVLKYFKGGSLLLLWIIFIVVLVDASSYFIGCRFKGPKFVPKVSPNKTWSGVFGGLIGGVVGALSGLTLCPGCSILALSSFGLIIAVSAIFGDLVESYIKRCQGVKDVKSIIPGHGGFLDRLDSMLVALPIAVAIIRISPGKLPFVLLP